MSSSSLPVRGSLACVSAILALALGSPASAQLKDEQVRALQDQITKLIAGGEHERALDLLGHANDVRTTRLMLKYMIEWTDVGLRPRMVESLTYVDAPECLAELGKIMDDKRAPLWLKHSIGDALQRKPEDHARTTLVALAGNKNLTNMLVGVHGLANRYNDPKVVPDLWKAFAHERWQVRYTAMLGLLRARVALAETPFLEPLLKTTGRDQVDLFRGLRTLNPSVPGTIEAWQDWIKKQGEDRLKFYGDYRKFESDTDDLIRERDSPKYVGPSVFGIKLRTNRVAFVVDSCETLNVEAKGPCPMGTVTPFAGLTLRKLILEEVAQAIEKLPPTVELMVVGCDRNAQAYASKPILADDATRAKLAADVRGMSSAMVTNLHDAIMRCFTTSGSDPLTEASYEKGPDTIVLVTTGMPTAGEHAYRKLVVREGALTWDASFLDAFDHLNRQRQIRFQCVGVGTLLPPCARLLQQLAQRSGGQFVTIAK